MKIVKNSIIYLFIILVIAALVSMPKVNAQTFTADGNPFDTESQESISILATEETFAYQDANLNRKPTVSALSDIVFVVDPEYGLSMNTNPDISVTPGDNVQHYYAVTNEGNAGDSYTLKCLYANFGGASNWTVEVWKDPSSPSQLGTLTPAVISNFVEQVPEDSDVLPYFEVYVSSITAEAPDGSYIKISCTAETGAAPTGRYQGGNDYWYGAGKSISDEVIDSVAAPVMVLTRTFTVDAPSEGGYVGGDYDPVPGAVITFTMVYSNEGEGAANNVFIVDKVPVNTTLAHLNRGGNQASGNVTITPAKGTATTWEVAYSTSASPTMTYAAGLPDWKHLGTIESTADYFPPGASTIYGTTEPDGGSGVATYVRWRRLTTYPIAADEDDKSLTWGVTIR
jgi:uncharacterized repeat protein (TIGR01451 family)